MPEAAQSTCDFAYLAGGKLHVRRGDAPVRVVDSQFGQSVRSRMLELQRRNEWKTAGTGAQFMRGGTLWGGAKPDPAEMPIRISGLARGCRPGELFYTLNTPEIAGLFAVRDEGEQRLFHTNDYQVSQVAAGTERVACVCNHRNGTSSIAVLRADGSEMAEITQGDTQDMAPRWIPGEASALLFQSAGIARNQAGIAMGRGPFAVHKLYIQSGQLETIAEDPGHDLLGPQMSPDGSLYYIRRPYEPPVQKTGFLRALLDFALLPFRLLFAVFHYLNFFSMMYTGKGLTNAGGAAQRDADIGRMMVWGNLIDARKAARQAPHEDAPALVPKSWELVRHDAQGTREILQTGVLHFDLSGDGSVLYSNGSAVYRRDAQGKIERLAKDSLIEQVVAL